MVFCYPFTVAVTLNFLEMWVLTVEEVNGFTLSASPYRIGHFADIIVMLILIYKPSVT